MIIDVIKDAILQNIGALKPASKSWQKRNCMLCHTQGHGVDRRGRFGIQFNSQSIAVNCFNCGFSAAYTEGKSLSRSFKFFLNQLNIDSKDIDRIEFEIFKQINKIKAVREGEEESQTKIYKPSYVKWREIQLPNNARPITTLLKLHFANQNFLKVANYAINRRIYNLDEFYWTPEPGHLMNQRLLIPYYFKGKIVGYTGRLAYDTIDKSIPKYYQHCPNDFVYNLDNQEKWNRKYVILTEGVLDAWTVDGVASLGEINKEKIDTINRLQKQVIVCPDRDASGSHLVQAAIENGWAVSFPRWEPGIKDAARAAEKYGRLLTTYSIVQSAVEGKDKIELKWRIESNARQRQYY